MEQTPSAENQQPSVVKIAWLAGFIDGEGCIRTAKIVRKRKKATSEYTEVTPRITITNTSGETIKQIHLLLDEITIGHHIHSKVRTSQSSRETWDLEIIGYKRAQRFLEMIIPHLVTKKQQAELLKAFVDYRLARFEKGEFNKNKMGGHPTNGYGTEVHEMLKRMHHDEGSETKCVATRLIDELKI